MKKLVPIIFLLLLLTLPAAQSQSEATVPPNILEFAKDFFTVYGNPEMVVSVAGSFEYKREDSATILIQVMNSGKVLGFEAEDDPEDANEIALSRIEHKLEYDSTTAVGVTASLLAKDAPVDIKTPPQSAGTLISGAVSEPLQFEIKVWDDAKAGTYPMQVNLAYQYQEDVLVDGNTTSNEIDYNMLYKKVNENHVVYITIKKEADFEAIDVESSLIPDSSGILAITFKNTGEETAKQATARLRLSDPLSSTDHTAFLGDMEPGDEALAKFDIDVDLDATFKTYSIKTEIEYEDSEGDIRISDTIYVPAQVTEPEDKAGILQNPLLLVGILLVLVVAVYIYMKRRGAGSEDE